MKRTTSQSDYRRTSLDMSHRTLKEIHQGHPAKKPTQYLLGSYLERPNLDGCIMPSDRDLELAKQQAAKFLPKDAP
jgi:hypothetical protein